MSKRVEKIEDITLQNLKNKISEYILPILAFVGIILSLELTVVYFTANFLPGAAPSFCSINSYVDCDGVARSAYSSILGIPLALYGLGFYSLIFLISGILKNKLDNHKAYVYVLSAFSLLSSLLLLYISVYQIEKFCILCYITYFLNVGIFWASRNGFGLSGNLKTTVNDLKILFSNKVNAITLALLAVIALPVLFFLSTSNILTPQNKVNAGYSPLNKMFSFGQFKGNILGDVNGKIVIREYTDFECPFCALSNEMLHDLVKEVKDVKVIHYDFPLQPICNSIVKRSEHKHSCMAAYYSKASKKQDKMVEFNELLFSNQQDLSETNILKLAKSIGLNTDRLKADAYSKEIRDEVSSDIKEAVNLGVTGTPTYFIGYDKYEGIMPYEKLKALVITHDFR